MSTTSDVVPVAWHIGPNATQINIGMQFSSLSEDKSHVDLMGKYGHQITPLYPQAMADDLQARIDELETQLFIARAEPALSLFEQLGLAALPAFPSVRGAL